MYQLTYNLYKIQKGRPLDHNFLSIGQRRRAGVADIVPTGWLQFYLALGFAGQWHLTQSANPPGSPSTKCSNDIQQPPPSVRLGVIAAWCNRFSHPVCVSDAVVAIHVGTTRDSPCQSRNLRLFFDAFYLLMIIMSKLWLFAFCLFFLSLLATL